VAIGPETNECFAACSEEHIQNAAEEKSKRAKKLKQWT